MKILFRDFSKNLIWNMFILHKYAEKVLAVSHALGSPIIPREVRFLVQIRYSW